MTSETRGGRSHAPARSTYPTCETVALDEDLVRLLEEFKGRERDRQRLEDERLRQLAVDLAAVDRAVKTYRRKCEGREPWTDFEALVPPRFRGAYTNTGSIPPATAPNLERPADCGRSSATGITLDLATSASGRDLPGPRPLKAPGDELSEPLAGDTA